MSEDVKRYRRAEISVPNMSDFSCDPSLHAWGVACKEHRRAYRFEVEECSFPAIRGWSLLAAELSAAASRTI